MDMKWEEERRRRMSVDSCFGVRPNVPTKGHEGDEETDEIGFLGK